MTLINFYYLKIPPQYPLYRLYSIFAFELLHIRLLIQIVYYICEIYKPVV